jgi:hypothetical protein
VAAALILLLSAIGGLAMVRPLRRVTTQHTLAGLFGTSPREALIRRWTQDVISTAERHERLGHFHRRLETRAWSGTTVRIAGRGPWCAWEFADGERWRVHHLDRPPRWRRRLVVHGMDGHGERGLTVRTYVPGSHGVVLAVADAHPIG